MQKKIQPKGLKDCKEFWLSWLLDYPVHEFVLSIQQYLTVGIDIGYKGPELSLVSPNWASANTFSKEVEAFIQDNIQTGAVVGPLEQVPEGYRASPLGAFRRKSTQKPRVIHDLSWPPGSSVNDHINPAECSVTYVTVDQLANLCALYPDPWLVKMDLKAAFLSCPVRDQDIKLLGFRKQDVHGIVRSYMFQSLPFGLRSAPRRFDDLAKALLFIMVKRGVPSSVVQYLDDYCCVAPSIQQAQQALDLMVETAELAGFKVQPEKTLGPYKALEFLGICILQKSMPYGTIAM